MQVHNKGPGGSVLTVSPDGLEVEVEQAGRPRKAYRYPALPDALLMHYAHAAAFVGLIASATPKVSRLTVENPGVVEVEKRCKRWQAIAFFPFALFRW